jgi:hypothetical protein
MKLPEDNDLLWIAKEGVKAPLPDGWEVYEQEGQIIYVNTETNEG